MPGESFGLRRFAVELQPSRAGVAARVRPPNFPVHDPKEDPAVVFNRRIEALYRRDWCGAWSLVVLLWVTVAFVLVKTWPHVPDENVKIVLLAGAVAVLLFNTAAIYAMAAHYAEDKHFIYGLDIQQADAVRRRRKKGGQG